MFDLQPIQFLTPGGPSQYHNPGVEAFAAGVRLYQSLCFRSRISFLLDRLAGRRHSLLDLAEVKSHGRLLAIHERGVQPVPVRNITGSECRSRDFDREFRPLCPASRGRWAGIYAARLAGVYMPAVELVQVGDCYFVRDGHHRISVAKHTKVEYLDARVTVWELAFEPEFAAGACPLVVA